MGTDRVAASVDPADLGSYQQAARLMLLHGLVTDSYPTGKALGLVLQWSEELAKDFRELFGYSLQTSARHARLLRRLDSFDPSQAFLAVKSGKPFDRRRLAYLCLALACLTPSRIEINLADLVKLLTPSANAIEHLGFDATAPGHKDALVDVLNWLADRGVLRVSDGSMEDWARDHDRGDALFDIDHSTCAVLFRPNKPLQHLVSAAGLLDTPTAATGRDPRRRSAAQRARRLLIEYPVVYFSDTDTETAVALRQPALAQDIARLTGLPVECRAEGIMLVDTTGHFTDKKFPGRGGAVNRTAGLMLAKIADLREDPDRAGNLQYLLPPGPGEEQADLLCRIDMALPRDSTLPALAQEAHAEAGEYLDEDTTDPDLPVQQEQTGLPFVGHGRLEQMITELYEEFGPSSFTNKWQADPDGLLAETVALLSSLRLVHVVPGGILVRPAAGRYRNITAVLPSPADGQYMLDF